MERVDLQYLCTAIGNLSGIPVRVYENGIQTFYTSMVDLPKDPLTALPGGGLCHHRPCGILYHAAISLLRRSECWNGKACRRPYAAGDGTRTGPAGTGLPAGSVR